MLILKKSALILGLSLCLLLPACSNSPWAQDLERSLAADPSLEDGSLFGARSSPAESAASPAAATDTPSGSDTTPSAQSPGSPTPESPSPNASGNTSDPSELVGPTPPDDWGNQPGDTIASPGTTIFSSGEFTDLAQAPTQLQSYIADLAKLGALRVQSSNAEPESGSGAQFQPNSIATRREYARWLVTANNLIYANQPARQIRLAVASDQPAFQDVPNTDPDFAAIQGLANAGLIPSPLSGDSTTVTFRPDAPLTRENLILWKVPVDRRKALPNATIEAVQQTWGFQDTPQIDPKALRAILADFENGDQSNIRRALGYTTLFQPDKPVTRAEAAAVLWFFGTQGDGLSARDILQPGQQGG